MRRGLPGRMHRPGSEHPETAVQLLAKLARLQSETA